MSKKIIQLNEEIIKGELKELVRSSVEETLNNPYKRPQNFLYTLDMLHFYIILNDLLDLIL